MGRKPRNDSEPRAAQMSPNHAIKWYLFIIGNGTETTQTT